jgi:hypothetical protein
MPIGGIPSHYDGDAIQPNLPYVDGMVWDTNNQLLPGDDIEDMFLPYVSGTASEINIGLSTNIRGRSAQSDLQLVRVVRDNSTSRPGGAWPEWLGIGRAGAWPWPGSYTATSSGSTRLVVARTGT